MLENIPTILEALDTATSALKAFTGWRSKTRGDARVIVEELKENSRYLWLVIEEDILFDDVVGKLSTSEYDRLLRERFDFNTLKRKRVASYSSLDGTDLSSWKEKHTSELVSNIYDKLKDLKTKYPHSKNSKTIRWEQRIRNVQKRILLLLRHVSS